MGSAGPRALAGCHFQLDHIQRAIRWFEAALEQDPFLPLAHEGLAEIARRRGDREAATRHTQAARHSRAVKSAEAAVD